MPIIVRITYRKHKSLRIIGALISCFSNSKLTAAATLLLSVVDLTLLNLSNLFVGQDFYMALCLLPLQSLEMLPRQKWSWFWGKSLSDRL